MHYLITGHTGFKGSWLALMLKNQGHEVSGISLDPISNSLFAQASLSKVFANDVRLDIRNREGISKAVIRMDPDVVIHLAAQPLVGSSFDAPLETFEVNLMGTLNVLESTRSLKNLKFILIVTTDKVYKNTGNLKGYREEDSLGGGDPYSASKAAADLATQSWANSFGVCPIAIARAGNVIGGGDWSKDRLVPDLVNAIQFSRDIELRNPNSVRPWQHVLDCLQGYLDLITFGIQWDKGGIWNFGPPPGQVHSVHDLSHSFLREWNIEGRQIKIVNKPISFRLETDRLLLDSNKVRKEIGWREKLDFTSLVSWTVEWYKNELELDSMSMCEYQINRYFGITQ
jgi:CDP-glucose 4,6-dehydratase